MRANQARLLLLLTVMLAILGAIQCPGSPKRLRTSFKNLTSGIARTVSRSLSRSLSRRPSRSGSDGNVSGADGSRSPSRSSSDGRGSGADGSVGNEGDMEQPASGEYGRSGSGRFPRSRSPSPPAGGGGRRGYGASSSSSSNEPARVYAGVSVERIGTICRDVNRRGDAHVLTNMKVTELADIIRGMREVAANDQCKLPGRGTILGSTKCQEIYAEFKKIPAQYQGECSNAVSANCVAMYVSASTHQTGDRICAFFIKTDMRSSVTMDGYWASLTECIQGIKNELFMEHQLASVGINPPESPPRPLLPHNYSPDH